MSRSLRSKQPVNKKPINPNVNPVVPQQPETRFEDGKIFSNDKENGIVVQEKLERNTINNYVKKRYIEITIDLTKHAEHSNPDEYAKKIAEICRVINDKVRGRTILCISSHQKKETQYIIKCKAPYQFTAVNYYNNTRRWLEIQSFINDMVQMKEELETSYKDYPVYIDLNHYSLVTMKNKELPFPQVVLTPIAFILGYLKGMTQSNLDDVVIEMLDKMIKERQTKGFGLNPNVERYAETIAQENGGLEKMKLLKDLFNKKQAIDELKQDMLITEVSKFNELPSFDLEDLSKFHLGDLLGCGGNAIVFGCTYEDTQYAIKQVPASGIGELRKEAFIIHHCNHPFILKMKGFVVSEINLCKMIDKDKGISDSCKQSPAIQSLLDETKEQRFGYLLMEKCDEQSFYHFVTENNPTEDVKKKFLGQIIDACRYLYEQKRMIHRDLKPDNILLVNSKTRNPEMRLCDFGFTKTLSDLHVTKAGTPCFCDPAIEINKEYDDRADLYSLGCILYFLTFNRYPFVQYDNNGEMECVTDREGNKIPKRTPILFGPGEETDAIHIRLIKDLLLKRTDDRMEWDEFLQNDYVKECLALVLHTEN